MKIGYAIEGAKDKPFIHGLRDRWCPEAALEPGAFRGSTRDSLRRDIPQVCRELVDKQADVLVFLTDWAFANWRDVRRRESEMVPVTCQDITVYGVAHRNVECWMAADPEYMASRLPDTTAGQLRNADDPKGIFDRARRAWGRDADQSLAQAVANAPMGRWLDASESFERFYEDCRDLSQRFGCKIPNERERSD